MPRKIGNSKLTIHSSPQMLINEVNRLKQLLRARLRSIAPIAGVSKDPFLMIFRRNANTQERE